MCPYELLTPVVYRGRPRAASLSRNIKSDAPQLVHTLQQEHSSVLSLITDENYIYSGSQSQDISVWDNQTYTLKATLRGHTGSVLALEYAPDKRWLFSSSGESLNSRVWCTRTLRPLYVLNPYLETDAGDLFCLAWSSTYKTIYIGCQNTCLQWYAFPDSSGSPGVPASSGTSTPSKKAHKFFDSYPRYQRRPADLLASNGAGTLPLLEASGTVLNVPPTNVIDSAHYGYVYCMALLPSIRDGSDDVQEGQEVQLVTGSGDETVKVWKCTETGLELTNTIACTHGAVLSIATRGDMLYAGCQDGYVKVWDLQANTLIRTIIVQENVDILSLSMLHADLYTFSANGYVNRFSDTFDCTARWQAHDGIVLSSIVSHTKDCDEYKLITGGNDAAIKVWTTLPPKSDVTYGDDVKAPNGSFPGVVVVKNSHRLPDVMMYALSKFVSIRSVSSAPELREDCHQAAIFLSKCLHQLGAHSKLLYSGDVHNPIVFATFQGTQTTKRKPRILFYGHYDVISAPPQGWDSDPFELTARNGFLYGRGVSDDKGPVLAVACAAAELLQQRKLGVDLVFLIEGEEETGSVGFVESVRKHREVIGDVDAILVSNSGWIACDVPSITYGLRGVIHSNIEISSQSKDAHSGVDGGAVTEPMQDMVQILATLADKNHTVLIPGFYDNVRPQDANETDMFRQLESVTNRSAASLAARWREPSLTIHNILGSGPRNPTVIPATVTAQVSLRIVPDQSLDEVSAALLQYIKDSFAQLASPNELRVSVDHTADWWLGNLEHPWFKALARAIRDEWQKDPMCVREGGSIPCVPFLEKEFGCPALHLPMGQSTDQAHLPNEHLSLSNLHAGKSVVERFLLAVADSDMSTFAA
ncbi:Zn-dependent exopeptidase [Artomyces pyxidatus]|uniref:Zn-dependent exopeptidase n=1 Tax=Artomyces pyxidatus TaxID=48021 RepID=A0ACB8SYR8_9AGAM|nr:Zn-dependent exopeptidase [Artomyces pyxidatus]